jgi:Ankyrin repeats (3 copies)
MSLLGCITLYNLILAVLDYNSPHKKLNKAKLACYMGHLVLLKGLIEHYDLNDYIYYFQKLAAECGYLEIVKYLCAIDNSNIKGILFISARYGHSEIIKYLMQNEFDSRTLMNASAIASHSGHTAVANILY